MVRRAARGSRRRLSVLCGRPPSDALGISGSSHSASVRRPPTECNFTTFRRLRLTSLNVDDRGNRPREEVRRQSNSLTSNRSFRPPRLPKTNAPPKLRTAPRRRACPGDREMHWASSGTSRSWPRPTSIHSGRKQLCAILRVWIPHVTSRLLSFYIIASLTII
jgi:hypothetical protein